MFSEEKLKEVMASILSVEPTSIALNSSKDNIPNWDSFKQMNLILALEEEFGITIPDEDAANLTSFQLIKLVVEELLGQR